MTPRHHPHTVKRIGEILRQLGYVSEPQIAEALKIQSKADEKRLLGQILVSRGHTTAARVQVALAKQQALRADGPRMP